MTDKYIEQLKPLFSQVAEKIGQGAEFGWAVVMKQQIVTGAIGLLWAVIGIIGGIIIIKTINKFWGEFYDDLGMIFLGIFGGSFCLIAFIAGSIIAITHFINPEYYALEFFINLVK